MMMGNGRTLVGHSAVVRQLGVLLAEGRFPHAVLLHGPKGIGKRVLADALLARLICGPAGVVENVGNGLFGDEPVAVDGDPLAPDITCAAWHQLQAGSCPDAYVMAPEEGKKSIGVKQIQALLEALQRSADTARVVIVDCLEDMTTEASNTLLKTLEEPRKGIYFLLVAHQLSAVLPTIRSRCRLIRLQPLDPHDVDVVLHAIGVEGTLARVANGCPGAVVGPAAAAQLALHEAVMAGEVPPMTAPHMVDVVAQAVASGAPNLARAEAYRAMMTLKHKAEAINLPISMVNEAVYELAVASGAVERKAR